MLYAITHRSMSTILTGYVHIVSCIQMEETNLMEWIAAQLVRFGISFVIWYAGGLLVSKKGVKANYTRKINHFSLMFIPFFMDMIHTSSGASNGSEDNFLLSVMGLLSGLLFMALFIKPIRERVGVINTAFLSVDRPEDRPFTLTWLTTQTAASFLVAIPLTAYLMSINKMELIFIIILINGFGDGLAEPIGIRFGKHKYETRALFTKRKYTRSLEGSACVFIAGLLAVILFSSSFSTGQFILALLAIPILMTLAEAFSPHSWDNAFLFLVGEILLFLILELVV